MRIEVYGRRLDPELEGSLAPAARARGRSVAGLIEEIVDDWLADEGTVDDDEAQRRLHAEARTSFGTLRGGNERLGEEAGKRLRRKREERHAVRRPG